MSTLVTSANLTGHGHRSNMELDLLLRGGSVPTQLADAAVELADRQLRQVAADFGLTLQELKDLL